MIVDRQRNIRIVRGPLENFLRRVRRELKLGAAEVSVAFVSDAEITRLNKTYRQKSGPTDVLSFRAMGLHANAKRGTRLAKGQWQGQFLGDIAIAPKTARRYAMESGRVFADELRILILHGVLHLMGYDHETDRGQMNRIERRLRRRLGLA